MGTPVVRRKRPLLLTPVVIGDPGQFQAQLKAAASEKERADIRKTHRFALKVALAELLFAAIDDGEDEVAESLEPAIE